MSFRLAAALIALFYLTTRLVGLEAFPCYFHSDEGTPTVHALKLFNDFFVAGNWYIPPLFFPVSWNYNLCTTVYLQLIGLLFAPPSLELTRGVAAIASLGAVLGLLQLGRNDQRLSFPWLPAAALLLSPLWLLHSRTGFESVTMVAAYAVALGFYAAYGRSRRLWDGICCVVSAIVSFHSYSAGQLVVPATFLILGLLDGRFHLARENRKNTLYLVGFAILLVVPYLHFRYSMAEILSAQLRNTASPFTQPLSWTEIATAVGATYLRVLNPSTWFSLQVDNIVRHQFADWPAILLGLAPLTLLGIVVQLFRWRDRSSKILLAMLLTGPLPSAVSSFSFLRSLTMLLPLAYLSGVAADFLLQKLSRRVQGLAAGTALLIILGAAGWMNHFAITTGCLWSKDYTLYGYQWGIPQIFRDLLPKLQAEEADRELWMSSTWAHSPEIFRSFYGNKGNLPLISPVDLVRDRVPNIEQKRFLFTADDLRNLEKNDRLTVRQATMVLAYPDGRPGFYLLSLEYSKRFEELLEAERAEELRMRATEVGIDGETVELAMPGLDVGQPTSLVDGNPGTLVRGARANPFELILHWKRPSKPLAEIEVLTSHHNNLEVSGEVMTIDGIASPCIFSSTPNGSDGARWRCTFPRAVLGTLAVRLKNPGISPTDRANIHINEVTLR